MPKYQIKNHKIIDSTSGRPVAVETDCGTLTLEEACEHLNQLHGQPPTPKYSK